MHGKRGTMRSPLLQCTMVPLSGLWMDPQGTQQQGTDRTVDCPLPSVLQRPLAAGYYIRATVAH